MNSSENDARLSHRRWRKDVSPVADAVSGEDRYHPSPYPLVDQFITSQLFREGVQGHIRRWTWFTQGKLQKDVDHERKEDVDHNFCHVAFCSSRKVDDI